MNNNNFGKDTRNMNEDELFFHINNHDPKFGSVCQYELMRRLTIENSRSSERFAKGAAYLALASIICTLAIGAVQVYLAVLAM